MRSVHGVKGVDAFLADLRFDLAHPPMTVHRLDRDTTGCLILARTREAQRTLAGYFQDRARVARRGSDPSTTNAREPESLGDVRRVYWALVSATSTLASRGTIDAPLVTTHAGVTLEPGAGAKPAATDYEVISRASPEISTAAGRVPALLALEPRTGRKHQLRVHCAGALDAAIVGDYKYGYRDVSRTGGIADDWRRLLRDVDERTRRLDLGSSDASEVRGTGVPLHLHARRVEFAHPSSGERVRVVAPPPSHMSLACEALGLALVD